MSTLNLPRKDKDGNPYISYSQITAWNEKTGFSTGKLGRTEFMMSYFFGQEFGDKLGFAQFGTEVEDYICLRKGAELFTGKELGVLNTIQPLGCYQTETKIHFDNFYVKSFIDDHLLDWSKIRDYKTCSRNSGKKYETPEYKQLDVYALAAKELTGVLPEKLEVCCIERTGNPFKGGGRSVLAVGNDVWYVDRATDAKRLNELQNYIINTAKEISTYYTVFQKLNKI